MQEKSEADQKENAELKSQLEEAKVDEEKASIDHKRAMSELDAERERSLEIKGDPDLEEYLELRHQGLVRTGRLFGGLIDDVKRKLPW